MFWQRAVGWGTVPYGDLMLWSRLHDLRFQGEGGWRMQQLRNERVGRLGRVGGRGGGPPPMQKLLLPGARGPAERHGAAERGAVVYHVLVCSPPIWRFLDPSFDGPGV